jgi:hypothetical protein
MDHYQGMLSEEADLNAKGELTVDKILTPGFYRILDGAHANRVIMYSITGKVDNKLIITFVNNMSWAFKDSLTGVRCERTVPSFRPPVNEVKKVEWYADNGDGPFSVEW